MKYRALKVLEVVMVALTSTAVGFCAMYFVEDCTYTQVRDNTTELYNLQVTFFENTIVNHCMFLNNE
jgi:hypothetical protein